MKRSVQCERRIVKCSIRRYDTNFRYRSHVHTLILGLFSGILVMDVVAGLDVCYPKHRRVVNETHLAKGQFKAHYRNHNDVCAYRIT